MTESARKPKQPNFRKVSQLQEKALIDRLKIARELIDHPSEKGRGLEADVAAVLREILPTEYGVGTGFVAYIGDDGAELSPQLDVIIYDAIRGGPIGNVSTTCEVYPLEAVYGYVEVKARLFVPGADAKERPDSLQACIKQNHRLRQIKVRHFWNVEQFGSPPGVKEAVVDYWPPMRGYVFTFDAGDSTAGEPSSLAQAMANYSKESDAHLHGLLILDTGFFRTRAIDPSIAADDDYNHVCYVVDDPFAAFKIQLLRDLGTYPRPYDSWVPAWEKYFNPSEGWQKAVPDPEIQRPAEGSGANHVATQTDESSK